MSVNPEQGETTAPELSPEQELAQAFHTPEEGIAPEEVQVEEASAPAASATPEPAAPTASAASTFVPFVIEHKGKEIQISTIEQAREYAQKGYDYTGKTMSLAEEKKAIRQLAETIKAREEQRQRELRDFLSDRNKVRQYLEALEASGGVQPQGAQPPAPPSDDDFEPVSRQELAALEAKAIAAAAARAKEEFTQALEVVEVQRMQAGYANDFDRTIKELVATTYPALQDVEGIEELILADGRRFFEAQFELAPERAVDPKAVKQVMVESAKRRAERLEARHRVREKQVALQKQELVTKGPEGPGGSAPPQTAARELDLKSDELAQAVLEDVRALMGR